MGSNEIRSFEIGELEEVHCACADEWGSRKLAWKRPSGERGRKELEEVFKTGLIVKRTCVQPELNDPLTCVCVIRSVWRTLFGRSQLLATAFALELVFCMISDSNDSIGMLVQDG